jgi:hypothetical protein
MQWSYLYERLLLKVLKFDYPNYFMMLQLWWSKHVSFTSCIHTLFLISYPSHQTCILFHSQILSINLWLNTFKNFHIIRLLVYMTLSDLCIFKCYLYIYITVPCKHYGICEIEYMFDGRGLRLERVCEYNL